MDGLAWLVLPPGVWLGHFLLAYAWVAVGCPRLADGLVHGGLAALTAAAFAGIAVAIVRSVRRARLAGSAADRFLALTTGLLAGVAAVGVAWVALSAVMVGGCP